MVTEAPVSPERLGLQDTVRRSDSVGLPGDAPCLFAPFTLLATGFEPAHAIERLLELRAFSEGERALICRDETDDDICRSEEWARHATRYRQAWHMHREDDTTVFWLGVRGVGAVTGVTLPDDPEAPVRIHHRLPPPF